MERILAGAVTGFIAGIPVTMILVMGVGARMFTDNTFATWALSELACMAIGAIIAAITAPQSPPARTARR